MGSVGWRWGLWGGIGFCGVALGSVGWHWVPWGGVGFCGVALGSMGWRWVPWGGIGFHGVVLGSVGWHWGLEGCGVRRGGLGSVGGRRLGCSCDAALACSRT